MTWSHRYHICMSLAGGVLLWHHLSSQFIIKCHGVLGSVPVKWKSLLIVHLGNLGPRTLVVVVVVGLQYCPSKKDFSILLCSVPTKSVLLPWKQLFASWFQPVKCKGTWQIFSVFCFTLSVMEDFLKTFLFNLLITIFLYSFNNRKPLNKNFV